MGVMTRDDIIHRLQSVFQPTVLTVTDDSHRHQGHAGVSHDQSNTHFSVLIVSHAFQGQQLVARHRMVMDALKSAFNQSLHALQIQTKTPSEWDQR